MDDLRMFFNTSEQTRHAMNLLTEFNTIAKIRANPTKSEYVTFNDKAKLPTRVNDQLIYPDDKNKNIRLLRSFFGSRKLLKNSTEHAIRTLKKECKTLSTKNIGINKLKYLINGVIIPSALYQFSTCPAIYLTLSKMNTITSMVLKYSLRLSKDFPRSLNLSPTGIGITDMEEAYLFKSLGDLLVASQPNLQNYTIAKNFKKQLGFHLNTNSNILKNPIWLNNRLLRHSFAYTQSLISQYKLSIGEPNSHEITLNNITNRMCKPINLFTLEALKHSGITDI
jgi:hypothetical protein